MVNPNAKINLIMAIYTKKGDKGETGLPGKRRLAKTDKIFEFLGSLDMANASVGLTVSSIKQKDRNLRSRLQKIQSIFLDIGSCVAAEDSVVSPVLNNLDQETESLEKEIDLWESRLPELKNFILPGGSEASSSAHMSRVMVRQAERAFHRLNNTNELEPIARYLNRLSDYFFQLARYLNAQSKTPDIIWKIERNLS